MPHRTPLATAVQDHGPIARYTQIPRELHDLAESPREFELMAALLSFRWFPSSPIIPSVKTLAGMLRCSQRTVRRTAAGLETRGLILREERRAPDSRQMSNLFHLCGPLLALVAAVEARADQEARPSWQGRRSNGAGKPEYRNDNNRTRRPGSPDPRADRDYFSTREGRLVPRV